MKLDPWLDLYCPALFFGDCCDCAEQGLESFPPMVAARHQGDWWAIAARAWLVLGRQRESEQAAERAFALGGAEVDALATFIRPSGMVTARRRMQQASSPGVAADAACDLAALALFDGDANAARTAIGEALERCPEHAETRRWSRFLTESADPVRRFRLAQSPRSGERARSPISRDAAALVPTRRAGWVSDERLARRVGSGGPDAPAGSALERLRGAGVQVTWFATDREYAMLPPDHRLVQHEFLADQIASLVGEGRDARDVAARLWEQTFGDPIAQNDAAQFLSGQATLDPRLAPIALPTVNLLLDQEGPKPLWRAYRAWLSHLAGDGRWVDDARAILGEARLDGVSWQLAIATLSARGRDLEARADASTRVTDAALGHLAKAFLRHRLGEPRVSVSPRNTPREDSGLPPETPWEALGFNETWSGLPEGLISGLGADPAEA